jgi:anaerobic magnesium-protoporphyrin IX monomethyl ester cyclase
MKVVLLRPNYNSHIITPPLGLGYLASFLKSQGIEVKIIDALRDNLPAQIVVSKVLAGKPDAVGITCLTAFYKEATELSLSLKRHGQRVIIGGVHPTFMPAETLRDTQADAVVCGEGEIALLHLVKNGFSSNGIEGVYSQADLASGKIMDSRAPIIPQLDTLPPPDWRQLDPRSYPKAPHGAIVKRFPIGVVTTTRGCPYPCTFCASPKFYRRKIRFRSPENVIAEIEMLIRDFGVREIHFEDDNFTLKREHVARICELMLQKNLRVTWACPNGIRADRVDKDLIHLMKRAGCYYFAYGIESANAQILKNIKKSETIEEIEQSIAWAHEAGISCQGFFIFGLPGETDTTIEQTIQFACRSQLSRAQFLILDVIPGSELWTTLEGQFQPDWRKNSYKEPEWLPEGMSRETLLRAQSRAFRKFYASPARFIGLAASIKPAQITFLAKRLREYRVLGPNTRAA